MNKQLGSLELNSENQIHSTERPEIHEESAQILKNLKKRALETFTDGRFEEAEGQWRELLANDPADGEILAGVAMCLLSRERIEEADPYVRKIAGLSVIHYVSWLQLGTKLGQLHRHEDAIAVFRSLARGYRNSSEVWNHVGAAELNAHRAAAALASLRKASALQPTSAAVWCNVALALLALDRLPEALIACRRALAIEPASSVAMFNMSYVLLAMGRLREGFAAYEIRFLQSKTSWIRQNVNALPWTGEPLDGCSILVAGEQANGDYIQFSRYLCELSRRGAKVTSMMPARLRRLMTTLAGNIVIEDKLEEGVTFDYQVPLMSLPHHCAAEDICLTLQTPYLSAEPDRVSQWKQRLGDDGLLVGVAWQGGRYGGGADFGRSFPLEALRPVARIPGIRLISLQLSDGLDQLAQLPQGMIVETFEGFDADEHAFLDAAAVMANLDLIITLDSAMAHLAGALGRPTWLALPFAAEWRWGRERADTPWYPTMRLFRQGVLGDWDGVFESMADTIKTSGIRSLSIRPSQLLSIAAQPTLPLVPTSCGEVLDKISILEIKVDRLQPAAAAQAEFELIHLRSTLDSFGPLNENVTLRFAELRRVNQDLWDVEDRLRIHEAQGQFDADFTLLARSVYRLNDMRAAIKREINLALNSAIIEQKSYGELNSDEIRVGAH